MNRMSIAFLFLLSAFSINAQTDTVTGIKPEIRSKIRSAIIPAQRDAFSANDTVPFVQISKTTTFSEDVACFVDGKLMDPSVLKTINPASIEHFSIKKDAIEIAGKKYPGQIHVEIKEGHHPRFVSLNDLKGKYIPDNHQPTLFMINDDFVKEDYNSFLVDEKYILKIIVDKVETLEKPLTIIRLLTRTEENLKEANTIYIR